MSRIIISQNNQFPILVVIDLVDLFSDFGGPLADAGAGLIDIEGSPTSLSAKVRLPWVVKAWPASWFAKFLGIEDSDPVLFIDVL